ncbi:MAG TPA: GAF domain-containing protein, partial [Gemmatimonadaceae bacterium]
MADRANTPMAAADLAATLRDPRRLAVLRDTGMLDGLPSPSPEFDRLTRLATRILGVPVSLVTLVDEDRQVFAGQCGLPEPLASMRETPLSHSFCQHTVTTGEPLVVEDARLHPLVRDNLAIADFGIVAYAGIPLRSSSGEALGSFCAIDVAPRQWSEGDLDVLRDLAASAATEIELRLLTREAQRRAAETEHERQQRLALVEATTDGIYTVDTTGLCTFANAAAGALLGWDPAELVGRELHELVHGRRPDGTPYPASECPLYRAFRAGVQMQGDGEVFWRRDGTAFPIDYTSSPIREDGRTVGAVVTFTDVTERKRSEQALRFLAEVGVLLGDTLDYGETMRRVARVAVPMLGDVSFVDVPDGDGIRRVACAHRDAEGQAMLEELAAYSPRPSDAHPTLRALQRGAPEIVAIDDAFRRRIARDERHLELLSAIGIESAMYVPLVAQNRTIGVLVLGALGRQYAPADLPLAEELARRAALAVDNAHLYRQAREATAARDDMLGIVSHDLRNPIHAATMSASLLLDLLPPEDPAREMERTQLRLIKRAMQRANRLIQDLLDARRIETGRLEVAPRPTRVGALVAEALETTAAAAARQGLSVESRVADALPLARADHERIIQVLVNLLDNAVKFTRRGGHVRLAASVDGGCVRFEVTDTGIGIPASQVANLFERDWQARRTDRRGVGLGLWIAQGIVEAHGGRIGAQSAEGEGTTV